MRIERNGMFDELQSRYTPSMVIGREAVGTTGLAVDVPSRNRIDGWPDRKSFPRIPATNLTSAGSLGLSPTYIFLKPPAITRSI